MTKPQSTIFASKPSRLLRVLCAFAVPSLIGCTNKSNTTTSTPNAPTPATAPTGIPKNPNSTRLQASLSPLNYFLGPGGNIRIIDATTNKTLATATAPLQSVIIVDDAKGVTINNQVIKAGPLTPGHRYELWLDQK